MGNCFTKGPNKTYRSESFYNVKVNPYAKANKNRVQTKDRLGSEDSGCVPEIPSANYKATGNSLYNSLYSGQSSPYQPRKTPEPGSNSQPDVNPEGKGNPSYRLKREDITKNDHFHSFNINKNYPDTIRQTTPPSERPLNANSENQPIRGHKRTGSSDLTLGHNRTGSSLSNVLKERQDSQKRVQADYIRKGNWAVTENKIQRSDQPDVTLSPAPQLNLNTEKPKILVDHIEAYNLNESSRLSSIHQPTSPSVLTRSDSCKNELNPVLRNKGNLQERRQIVSAMHLDLTATNSSGSEDQESPDIHRQKMMSSDLAKDIHATECVIKWKKGNLLGKGSFGKVYSALTEDGQIVAVKQIEIDISNWAQAEADYKLIQKEVDIQKTLNHPNIVKFLDCGLDVSNYSINILMEYVSGGTIASLLKKFGTFEESVFQRYSSQLVDAVTYLHSNNVIHRDIKGSNIMVTSSGFIKLIDFGTAKRTTDDLVTPLSAMKLDFCLKGTPYWMAPEVVQMAEEPSAKADVWSIGCTVIEMATGSPPYFHMQPMSALFIIGSMEKPSPKLPEEFSPMARDFVDQCLTKFSQKRPTATQLGTHPFMLPEFIKQYHDNRAFYI